MDSAAKIYDILLNQRLAQWMDIDRVQAESQKKRSCVEQILALRLLMDHAKCTKKTLFILFIDFQKAYDRVPRSKLLECLKERGCGRMMLSAIAALYRCTRYVL